MSKQINLVINGKGGVGKSDCRAASTGLFIDFFDEIRKLDRTVLAQILAQFAFSGLTRT
jgi:anion-transporting  ArsA/GET3 family ATPase